MLEAVKRRKHREPLARLCDRWLKSKAYSVMFLEGSPTEYADRNEFKHVGEAHWWVTYGKEPRRLHAVNKNKAVIAQVTRHTRRLKHIHTYGKPIEVAAQESGGVNVINLDFCAYISESVLRTVTMAVDAAIVSHGVVAVAVMKGREPFWKKFGVPPTDPRRARKILIAIEDAGFKIEDHAVHDYQSGVPMFWLAAKVRRIRVPTRTQ